MMLAIDIGNSNIVISVFTLGQWLPPYRFETRDPQPSSHYDAALRQILLESSIKANQLEGIVISSVVPAMNDRIVEAVTSSTGLVPLLLGPDVFTALDMPVPHPYEIGADLVSNAYGAITILHGPCLIVDFGTALTFTTVTREKGITGVTIAPGVKTAIESLSTKTAQLPAVPPEFPSSVLGHDTVTAIQAGVMWGYTGLIREITTRIKEETRLDFITIATGGLSGLFAADKTLFDHHLPHLTLDGMRRIALFIKQQSAK